MTHHCASATRSSMVGASQAATSEREPVGTLGTGRPEEASKRGTKEGGENM